MCCLSDLNSFSLQRLGSLSPPLDDISFYVSFPANRFRFHTHEDFQANRDVVGHLRLVNGQSLIDHHVLDEAKMISKRHILWRPVMKLYLWDQAAKDFTRNSDPMKSHPHRFFGHNCEPKNSSRLSSNLEIAKRVNTNEETMAIRQIFAYIKQEYAKIKKLLLTT